MTDTHVYFLGGPFSQWHPSLFIGKLIEGGPEFEFNCCEQYMMAFKAMLMKDFSTVEKILRIEPPGGNASYFNRAARPSFFEVPKAQKAAGRAVSPWDQTLWDDNCMQGVFVGNFYKFTQDLKAQEALLATGGRILVEGASYDREWGVGIDWSSPLIEDERNWKGKNRLGRTVGAVRDILNAGDWRDYDPFTRTWRSSAGSTSA